MADTNAPATPKFGTIEGEQITTSDPDGETDIDFVITAPTRNQIHCGELLGTATGSAQTLYTDFTPITATED